MAVRAWIPWVFGVAITCLIGCGSTPTPAGEDAGSAVAFGELCLVNSDCASGLCVQLGDRPGHAICTRTCGDSGDCPESDNWGCVVPVEGSARICGCVPTGAVEVCGDDVDNDCDGAIDDCRLCGGVSTPLDDPANCGSCGNVCDVDEICADASCRCAPGRVGCGGACVDPATDSAHCGGCGNRCPAQQICTDSACVCPLDGPPDFCPGAGCVNLQRDAANCGACGRACASGQSCVDGVCACPSGLSACDGSCVDLEVDSSHCGSCGNACGSGQTCSGGFCRCSDISLQACADGCFDLSVDISNCGSCGFRCATGQYCSGGSCQCPRPGQVACAAGCVDTRTSRANCGYCGHDCGLGHSCSAGVCVCFAGQIDCDAGCTDPLTDGANCGACGNACPTGQVCQGGACECPGRTTRCGDACVRLADDSANCGACGDACASGETCSSGRCVCSGAVCPGVGCVDVVNDPSNCGYCGNACAPGQTCRAGVCGCAEVTQTYCGGSCVDTLADDAHCGSCDNACAAAESCVGGACSCGLPGERFCASAGGCVDTFNDVTHCGGCDRVCPAGTTCALGSCVCPGDLDACSDGCHDLTSDVLNCGACGNVCPASVSCWRGSCVCSTYGDTICGGSCVTTRTDPNHCGGCGNVCAPEASCSSGLCVCPTAGLSSCPDGCHDFTSDPNHCGACGNVCAGGTTCSGGDCLCPPPPALGAPIALVGPVADSLYLTSISAGAGVFALTYLRDGAGHRLAMVRADGSVITDVPVSTSGLPVLGSKVAFAGGRFGVVSMVGAADRGDLEISLFDSSGARVVDGRPLRQLHDGRALVAVEPSASAGYLIAYRQFSETYPGYSDHLLWSTSSGSPLTDEAMPWQVLRVAEDTSDGLAVLALRAGYELYIRDPGSAGFGSPLRYGSPGGFLDLIHDDTGFISVFGRRVYEGLNSTPALILSRVGTGGMDSAGGQTSLVWSDSGVWLMRIARRSDGSSSKLESEHSVTSVSLAQPLIGVLPSGQQMLAGVHNSGTEHTLHLFPLDRTSCP